MYLNNVDNDNYDVNSRIMLIIRYNHNLCQKCYATDDTCVLQRFHVENEEILLLMLIILLFILFMIMMHTV